MKEKYKSFVEIILIVIFFIMTSYFIQKNIFNISNVIDKGFLGMLVYVFVVVVAIVIAPISAIPLLPIASNIWGWFAVGLLSILGWTIGALIAFLLARVYGIQLINKFISLKKINKLEKLVPKENIFWSIVFLRMSFPVDILSYALGLFSKISLKRYLLATIIGITPFAFILAYAGTISFYYQISAFILAILIFLIGVLIVLKKTINTVNK